MESLEHHDQKLKSKTVLDERFEILSVLSESSTATLYHGHHLLLDKSIIIKVLHDQCKESASFKRFQREISALSTLNHAHIVTAYATGIYEEHPFLVTEEMDAISLADLFAQQDPNNNAQSQSALDLETKRSIICQVCDALTHLQVEEDAETKDFSSDALAIINDADKLLHQYEKETHENKQSQK